MALLTEEEVQHYLGVSPSDVQKLVKRGRLTAYRLGGTYVRFKKEEVAALKNGKKFVAPDELGRSRVDRIRDFWKFYSFYIITSILVALLAVVLFQL